MGRKALLIAMMVSAFGCKAMTELKPGKCEADKDCKSGQICDKAAKSCVDLDSGVADTLVSQGDSPVVPLDMAVDSGAKKDTWVGTEGDAPVVDTPVADTAIIGCRNASDCTGVRSLCVGNVCVECASADDCKDPGKAFCTGGTCTGCEQAGNNACPGKVCAPAGTPDAGGQCVECVSSTTCKSATAPVCDGNACVACTSSDQCKAKGGGTPACLVSAGTCVACVSTTDCQGGNLVCDTRTNTCVGCTSSAGCGDATPICTGGACVSCKTNKQCSDRDTSKPLCSESGGCVQCLGNSDCGGNAGRPFCDPKTNKCEACVSSADCTAADTPICAGNVCMSCKSHEQCVARSSTTKGCSGSGKCVGCTEKSHCSSTPATPECEPNGNKCVQCLDDNGCGGATPLCVGNKCVGCTSNDACGKKNTLTPACVVSGGKAGSCVECKDDTTCTQAGKVCNTEANLCVQCVDHTKCNGRTPLCEGNQCVSCNGLAATECKSKNPDQPACAATGACVQCTDNAGCADKGNLLVCKPDTNTCVECLKDSNCGVNRCKTDTNSCVQCLGNGDCKGTTPICGLSTNTCQPCTSDSQCTGVGAGICITADGHCATTDETVSVSGTIGSSLLTAIPSGKNLVVISGNVTGTLDWNLAGRAQAMTIAGQSGTTAKIDGVGALTSVVHATGLGDLYIKNLTITGGGATGLRVDGSATIHLDHVSVSDNAGNGIVINNAGFDIKNTTVDKDGSGGGNGIYLTSLPTSGKPKTLTNVSVTSNLGTGVFCVAASDTPSPASGILLTGNASPLANCTFAAGATCTTASASCGAQP